MGTREKRIGIRELKSTLSECVREVRAGKTIVVADHSQPVARIIPEALSLRERVDALRRAGAIAWSGRLRPAKPAGKVRGALVKRYIVERGSRENDHTHRSLRDGGYVNGQPRSSRGRNSVRVGRPSPKSRRTNRKVCR